MHIHLIVLYRARLGLELGVWLRLGVRLGLGVRKCVANQMLLSLLWEGWLGTRLLECDITFHNVPSCSTQNCDVCGTHHMPKSSRPSPSVFP